MDRVLFSWCRRHPDLSALLFLALVSILLMSPYLFRADVIVWPRSDLGTDFLNYRWAHVYHLRESLRRDGQVPLWRPSTMGGEPLIGNPAVMLSYPLQLLMALLPVPIFPGFAWLTAFHLWLAGAGTWVFVRKTVGLGRQAALLSALAMTLTPRLSSYSVGDVGIDYALCWVPLTLAWASLALQRRRVLWAILAGMGLAAQFLLHIQVSFYAIWMLGLLVLHRLVILIWPSRMTRYGTLAGVSEDAPVGHGQDALQRPHSRRDWKVLLRAVRQVIWPAVLMGPVFVGLVAFQLLPFVRYLPYLSRASMSLARADAYALPPILLTSVFFPCPLRFTEWELYVGLLPLFLLPWAAAHPRRDQSVFWLGVAVLAILFSLGNATPLFALLYRYVPGFRWLRVPVRLWFMFAMAVAVFLGMAVDVLKERSSAHRLEHGQETGSGKKLGVAGRLWLMAGGWLLALTTIAGRWVMEHGQATDWILGVVGAVGLFVGVFGIWLWIEGRIRFGTLCTMLVIGLLLDLLPVDAAYMRAMPVDEAFEMPEIGRGLLVSKVQDEEPFRVYSVRDEIPDHVAVYEGLELLEGLSSFQFGRYVSFAKRASGCTLPGFAAMVPPCASNELSATAYLDAVPDPALLGLFNVRYVVTPLTLGPGWTRVRSVGGENLYENDLVLPRVFAVGRAEVVDGEDGDGEDVDGEETLWLRLSEIDLRTTALLETPDAPSVLPENPFYADAHLLVHRPNDLQIEVDMPDDGVLVLGEVWTPGWHATDNGEPVPVLRVNGTMRGLLLAEGRHEVRLFFRPREMVWGIWMTAVAVLGCVVVLIREFRN